MTDDTYVSTNPYLLFIIMIILIIILTYIFDRYINPFSENHAKYNSIISQYIARVGPTLLSKYRKK